MELHYLVIRFTSDRVVDHHVILLHCACGLSDDVDDFDVLGHGSCYAVQSAEFAYNSHKRYVASMHKGDTYQPHGW